MKLENNWRQKTLENLEKENWGDPSPDDGHLVRRTMELRRVQLEKFSTEDLRIMIGQEFGLLYLLPLAFETLKRDLLVEGDYYPGDLLNMTLKIKHSFWLQHQQYWKQLNDLIKDRIEELREYRPRLSLDTFYSTTY
jgi:hypothetical protein